MSEIANRSGEAVDAEALKKAEEFIEEEEGRTNRLRGRLGVFVTTVAIVMSLFHLYSAYAIVPTQVMRPVHVGFVLFLVYLLFPVAQRYRHRIMCGVGSSRSPRSPSSPTSSGAATISGTATLRRTTGTSCLAWCSS